MKTKGERDEARDARLGVRGWSTSSTERKRLHSVLVALTLIAYTTHPSQSHLLGLREETTAEGPCGAL